MIHVYLDDLRPCPKGFVLAKNVDECLELLKACDVDILSLDHDLGWGEPTGTELARMMAARGLYGKRIYLHTSSREGCRRMYELLYQAKPESVELFPHAMPAELVREIAQAASEA